MLKFKTKKYALQAKRHDYCMYLKHKSKSTFLVNHNSANIFST